MRGTSARRTGAGRNSFVQKMWCGWPFSLRLWTRVGDYDPNRRWRPAARGRMEAAPPNPAEWLTYQVQLTRVSIMCPIGSV